MLQLLELALELRAPQALRVRELQELQALRAQLVPREPLEVRER